MLAAVGSGSTLSDCLWKFRLPFSRANTTFWSFRHLCQKKTFTRQSPGMFLVANISYQVSEKKCFYNHEK